MRLPGVSSEKEERGGKKHFGPLSSDNVHNAPSKAYHAIGCEDTADVNNKLCSMFQTYAPLKRNPKTQACILKIVRIVFLYNNCMAFTVLKIFTI